MDTVINIFRFIHSWNRWLIVLIVIIALIYFVQGWVLGKPWTKRGQTLLTTFSSLVGLQWILGLILLATYGSITGYGISHFWEHFAAQTVALGVSHMHMPWRKKEFDDKTRYLRGSLLIIGVMLLILLGIMVLPDSIQWRFIGV